MSYRTLPHACSSSRRVVFRLLRLLVLFNRLQRGQKLWRNIKGERLRRSIKSPVEKAIVILSDLKNNNAFTDQEKSEIDWIIHMVSTNQLYKVRFNARSEALEGVDAETSNWLISQYSNNNDQDDDKKGDDEKSVDTKKNKERRYTLLAKDNQEGRRRKSSSHKLPRKKSGAGSLAVPKVAVVATAISEGSLKELANSFSISENSLARSLEGIKDWGASARKRPVCWPPTDRMTSDGMPASQVMTSLR